MKAIIVVPTIREDCIKRFLERWEPEFRNHLIMVVEDHPTGEFDLCQGNVLHYCHEDIDRDLGDKAWIISRGNSGIRSYGFWKAWQRKPDMIVTLDDDCYPTEYGNFLGKHWSNLNRTASSQAWVSTLSGANPRGHPYHCINREWPVAISHGLWEGNPDFDAVQTLTGPPKGWVYLNAEIPLNYYFPMCSMNLAVRTEFAPLMYFGLQGPNWPYDRFDDIWCGVIAKRVLDRVHWAVWSGHPHVKHERASDPWVNLRKEVRGLEANETFWQKVDDIKINGHMSATYCFQEIAGAFLEDEDPYFQKLGAAMGIWAGLFMTRGAE